MNPPGWLKRAVRAPLSRLGYEIARSGPPDPLITLVEFLREHGFTGDIESFEPVKAPAETARLKALGDRRWRVHEFALGAEDGTAEMYIAGNAAASSSLLQMEQRHLRAAPESAYVSTQEVQIRRLDGFIEPSDSRRGFLKLDVQGYEGVVLDGCGRLLGGHIVGVQLELSLMPLYRYAPAVEDLLRFMRDRGYVVRWSAAGFRDHSTGELLQIDAALFLDGVGEP